MEILIPITLYEEAFGIQDLTQIVSHSCPNLQFECIERETVYGEFSPANAPREHHA